MQFKFPLLNREGKEITEADVFLRALQREKSGFFPIDADGLWYNGIDFSESERSPLALDAAIRCVADGEVVAYRLPARYKKISLAGAEGLYSNAFTLVRHVYETPKGNILVFFSLYMNLLPYDFYATQVLPGYLQGDKVYKVGDRAVDREDFAGDTPGIRIRHQPSGEVIALLPQGSKLSLKADSNTNWKPVDRILAGTPLVKPGWVWKPELDNAVDGVYKVGDKAVDVEDFAQDVVGLRMRAVARGRVVALLPTGTKIRLDQESDGKWRKVKEIVSGDPVLAPGWVFQPELDTTTGLPGRVVYRVNDTVTDTDNDIAAGMKGLSIRLAPNGRVMGLLEAGTGLTLGERQGNWAKIITIEVNTSAQAVYKKGWVWLPELDQLLPGNNRQYYRVGGRANDRATFTRIKEDDAVVTGLNMRLEPNGFLMGMLPRGSALELGPREGQWAQIKAIHEGKPVYNTAWVWVPELDWISGDLYQVGNKARDRENSFAPGVVGIRMRDLPTRAIVALLPRGVQIELEPHQNRWAKIRRITSGSAIYPPAWVWVPELDPPRAVETFYQVSAQARDRADFAGGETGLNMRLSPNGIVMGLLTRDVQITLDSSSTSGWNRVGQIIRGEPVYKRGWVWVPELDRLSESRYLVGSLALDKEPAFAANVTGIRMRHLLSRETLALIPQGTELELEAHTGRWAKIKSIHRNKPVYRPAWVWTPELEAVQQQATSYTVGNAANDIQPSFAGSAVGLRMRTDPAGDIMALIPKGAELEIGDTQGSWGKVSRFVNGKPLYAHGWVWVPELDEVTMPPDPDSVTITRQSIKAGEPVGYAGSYRDLAEDHQQHFHLQLFTSDNLPRFLANPYRDTGGEDSLRIPAQTPLFDQVETDAGLSFEASGISLANDVIVDTDVDTETDRFGVEWIAVNGYSIHSSSEQGWVKKVAAQQVSSLKWPGFHIMDTTNEVIADSEDRDFLEQIYASYQPPVEPPLPPSIIQQAYTNDAQLASLSRTIIRNEAIVEGTGAEEWLKRRVEYLLLQEDNPPEELRTALRTGWQQRLGEWGWWDDAAKKIQDFPQNRQAYYFHPVRFIENIATHPDKYILTDYPGVITLEMLQAVKRGNTLYYREILPYMNEFASKYNVNTPLRIAHFLSQIGHESSFVIREESLKYSVNRMRSIFGRGGARTKLYDNPGYYAYFYKGRKIPNNDVHLGNYVYANRLGNGNEASGDGFRYRGRGMIQLTGKDNYRLYTKQHNKVSPDDPQDFVLNPDLVVSNKRYGVESAFVWWERNNMNRAADRTYADISNRNRMNTRIKTITRLVNGGLNGITERTRNFWKVWKIVA